MRQLAFKGIIATCLGILLLFLSSFPSTAISNSSFRGIPNHPSDKEILHFLNRTSFGPKPGDMDRVKAMGIELYLQQQLSPQHIPLSQKLLQELNSLETLHMRPLEIFQKYGPKPKAQQETKSLLEKPAYVVGQASQAHLSQALESDRQLQEVMIDFWLNHFNIYAAKGNGEFVWLHSFEENALRPYALGHFRDLLEATSHHPAMLVYLDNWQNTAPDSPGARGNFKGINENYARELMELHTLGVEGGYTEQDVIALAHILTGWGVIYPGFRSKGQAVLGRRVWSQGLENFTIRNRPGVSPYFQFETNRHDFRDKVFLGHPIKGSGETEGEEALDILAKSPATAKHLAYQLAQYFVADAPPQPLVDRLSKRYLETNGNIREMLNTLFHSPEFWDSAYYQAKFKNPYRYVLSTLRASGISNIQNYWPLVALLNQMGMSVYGCQTPDGYKNTQAAWLNPDALAKRLTYSLALARGHLPLNTPPNDMFFSQGGGVKKALSNKGSQPTMPPVSEELLEKTYHYQFSTKTQQALKESPQQMRAAMLLGSSEMMNY